MGYEDTKLLLADDETFSLAANGANSGGGGLGQQSVDLALEPGGTTEFFRNYDSMGNGRTICLSGIVGTSVTGQSFGDTMEFQIVSLPFDANYLDDGPGGAGDGKSLVKSGMLSAAQLITFDTPSSEFQDIPLGTPFYFTDIDGLTGVAVNTIYYFVPENRLSFSVATSLANAIAGATITIGAGPNTVSIDWTPAMTIHASTGGLSLYNAGVPTSQSALRAGNRFEVPLRPLLGATPRHLNSALYGTPTPATGFHKDRQPVGAGGGGPGASAGGPPTTGTIQAHANQFYYLRYVPGGVDGAAVTAGSFTTGVWYRILTVGSTDYTLIGAHANTVGVTFQATGAGSGTGTATPTPAIATGSLKKASLVLTGESQLVYPGSGYDIKG